MIPDDESMVKSTWAEDMGQFLYHLDPNKKNTRKLKKLQLKITNRVLSSLIKLALITTCCLNIHFSRYIHISMLRNF